MSASIGSTDRLPTNSCPGPRRSFYTFSHDGTIRRFTRISFPFALFHFTSAFFGNFDGSLGLMIPQGFGYPIASFANPHSGTRRDTPSLTIGHTPLSFGAFATSSRGAFPFRGHSALTSATHVTGTVGWMRLFLYLFFTSVDHVHALGHGHVPGVVGRVADLGWTFGWRCGAQKVALPLLRRPWSQYWYA